MAKVPARKRYDDSAVTVDRALKVLERRMAKENVRQDDLGKYLRLKICGKSREIFHALFLDAQLRLIAGEDMFLGTIDRCQVFPREIAKRALEVNAHSIMIAHNHPGGASNPSDQDIDLTHAIGEALRSIDVRLIDHWIVGGSEPTSFVLKGIPLCHDEKRRGEERECSRVESGAISTATAEAGSQERPVLDYFKDWNSFNAAAIAINNAAAILAAAAVTAADAGYWALCEAANLIDDVLTAMEGHAGHEQCETWEYLNRAASICELVSNAGCDMGDKNRTQALNAAESLLHFVDDVYFAQSAVASDFARLRKPDLFEEGRAMWKFLDSPAPGAQDKASIDQPTKRPNAVARNPRLRGPHQQR